MDFSSLINVGIVGGIIGIIQAIKVIDKNKNLTKVSYIILSVALGFISGFIVTPYSAGFQWVQSCIAAGITYGGAASLAYQFGKIAIVGEKN